MFLYMLLFLEGFSSFSHLRSHFFVLGVLGDVGVNLALFSKLELEVVQVIIMIERDERGGLRKLSLSCCFIYTQRHLANTRDFFCVFFTSTAFWCVITKLFVFQRGRSFMFIYMCLKIIRENTLNNLFFYC